MEKQPSPSHQHYTVTRAELDCLLGSLARQIYRAKSGDMRVAYYEAAKLVATCFNDPDLVIFVNITIEQMKNNLL